MARKKDFTWECGPLEDTTIEQAQLAVLQDIRDQLKQLNSVFSCHNFQDIPNILRGIRKKIPIKNKKPRRKK